MTASDTSTQAAPIYSKAWLALAMGLVGCLIAPVAPVAWVVGRQAVREIETADALGGRSLALVGKWLGIVVSVALLAVVLFGLAIAVWAVLQIVTTFS